MIITWGGAAGFAAGFALFLAAIGWFSTRRLFYGRFRSSPYSAVRSGWRSSLRLIRAAPAVAVGLFAIKLSQSLGKDLQNMFLWHHLRLWSVAGILIELAFTLAWAAVALNISFFILTPELSRDERRVRMRRAVLYAAGFWALMMAANVGGILLVFWRHGTDHGVILRIVRYFFYVVAIVAALVRPAIAVGVPNPLRECRRIVRENWMGISIALLLGVLPLWLVFYTVNIVTHIVRMPLALALGLELPIAALSALCYLAFEGTVAAMYKRIM